MRWPERGPVTPARSPVARHFAVECPLATFFYEDVLGRLRDGDVRFVLVGGTAVILHGVPRTTADRRHAGRSARSACQGAAPRKS